MTRLPFLSAMAVGVVLGVLLWALRRWYDPVPWRPCLVLVVVLLVHLGPNLLLGRSPLPLNLLDAWTPWVGSPDGPSRGSGGGLHFDVMKQGYPWFVEVRRQLRDGEIPLWNPRSGAGTPLLADPQAEAAHPFTLLGLPLPDDAALTLRAALRISVAFLFTFLFLARSGLGEGPSTLGAAAFSGGGFLATWLSWPSATSAAMLPALLYGVARLDEPGGRRDELFLTVAVFTLVVGGHVETMGYAFALAALIAGGRLLRRPPGRRAGVAARLAAALGLGVASAAFVLLPAAEMLRASHRYKVVGEQVDTLLHGGHLWDELTTPEGRKRWADRATGRLIPLVAPRALGSGPGQPFRGPDNWIERTGGFVGTATLLLTLAALVRRRRTRLGVDEGVWKLVLVGSVVALLVPMPVAANLARVPFFAPFAQHLFGRILVAIAFSVAVLAACELERWRRGTIPIRWLAEGRRMKALQVGLLALVVAENGRVFAPHHPSYEPHADFPKVPALTELASRIGHDRLVADAGTLPPNLAGALGLADARIDGPGQPAAYIEVLAPVLPPGGDASAFATLDHPLLDLIGVRYVLRAGRPPDRLVDVEERPRALPLLFLPTTAQFVAASEAPERLAGITDFRADALVEGTGEPWRAVGAAARLAVLETSPRRIRVEVEVVERRLLASRVYQDGGWRVRVDGQPATTVLTNAAFVGVWLPPGRHLVELWYEPSGWRCGLVLSLLSLVTLATRAAWPRLPAPRPLRCTGVAADITR